MHLVVNGERREVRRGLTIKELLDQDGEPAHHVLVEVNGTYLPTREYGERVLVDGDRVEIIRPAYGG
jgi:thiamine biosynthesis protein ThiS